jgi:hypothetical protein
VVRGTQFEKRWRRPSNSAKPVTVWKLRWGLGTQEIQVGERNVGAIKQNQLSNLPNLFYRYPGSCLRVKMAEP